MTDPEPRWLSPDQMARYIDSPVDKLPRLIKEGRIPKPTYTLGPRSPRFDRLEVDRMFSGGTTSVRTTNIGDAVANACSEILNDKSRTQDRSPRHGGRQH